MTENRRRVGVTIAGGQRAAAVRTARQGAGRSVTIEKMRPARSIVPAYEGDYDVTPGNAPVVLETGGKLMTGNVTVAAIPVVYADNAAGGQTCTIG